jgi:hypothetical protein
MTQWGRYARTRAGGEPARAESPAPCPRCGGVMDEIAVFVGAIVCTACGLDANRPGGAEPSRGAAFPRDTSTEA